MVFKDGRVAGWFGQGQRWSSRYPSDSVFILGELGPLLHLFFSVLFLRSPLTAIIHTIKSYASIIHMNLV